MKSFGLQSPCRGPQHVDDTIFGSLQLHQQILLRTISDDKRVYIREAPIYQPNICIGPYPPCWLIWVKMVFTDVRLLLICRVAPAKCLSVIPKLDDGEMITSVFVHGHKFHGFQDFPICASQIYVICKSILDEESCLQLQHVSPKIDLYLITALNSEMKSGSQKL